MKKILFIMPVALLAMMIGTTVVSCFAPSYKDGDTVAASVFEPADTILLSKKKVPDSLRQTSSSIIDSVDIFYVGTGSTRKFLQLVSYPSKRDTLVYGKTRHIKVIGSADVNNIVRVKFYLLDGKDSLVSSVEQLCMEQQ